VARVDLKILLKLQTCLARDMYGARFLIDGSPDSRKIHVIF